MSRHVIAKILTAALAIIILAGCSSKKSNPVGPDSTNPFNPSVVSLNTPDKALLLCGANFTGEAYTYTTLAKKYDSLFSHLTPSGTPADSIVDGDSVVYTWTADQLGIKLIRRDTASAYGWRIIFNGNRSGIDYTDWTYIEAGEKHDKSIGAMQLTENLVGAPNYHWGWTLIGGQTNVLINWYVGVNHMEVKISLSSDKTGYLECYVNDAIDWKVDWGSGRPSCSGMWYDYTEGHVTSSGSWGYSEG
ncbi:exported hypothetical protein [Candidatus Zixiibacteriota bacterium]|nr:exported hypothetical protein [candidate division Zixibacteria bacterium]